MSYYRVEVERVQRMTFYLEQNNSAAALGDAEELVDSIDPAFWQPEDDDLNLFTCNDMPKGTVFWTGGPHGDWKVSK